MKKIILIILLLAFCGVGVGVVTYEWIKPHNAIQEKTVEPVSVISEQNTETEIPTSVTESDVIKKQIDLLEQEADRLNKEADEYAKLAAAEVSSIKSEGVGLSKDDALNR